MKTLLANESHRVGLLASGNLVLAAIGQGTQAVQVWVAKAQPVLHLLLTAGQIAVALVTVYYIWRKSRAVPEPGKPRAKRKRSK